MSIDHKLPLRGFLLHISHYDPEWCKVKSEEKPFDLTVALEIVNAMAASGMNMLIIDCADGVEYKSHPELRRHYTVPMAHLEELSEYAREHGIEVVPKLNFSQSRFNRHNHWMYPHNEYVNGIELFESEKYWEIGFEIIDELISVCKPERFFHIGMDEDNDRSCRQFGEAITRLHNGLAKRNLRTVIWIDTRTDHRGEVYTEKHEAVEDKIPRNVVRIIWCYKGLVSEEKLNSIAGKGLEFWGAPGTKREDIILWKETLMRLGGTGMIMTNWQKCIKDNEASMLKLIMNKGKLYS